MITIGYFVIVALMTPVLSTIMIMLLTRRYDREPPDYVFGFFIGFMLSLIWFVTIPLSIVFLITYKASPFIEKFVNKIENKLERFI